MVDIPYPREMSGPREGKVIQVCHVVLHLRLADMDEPYSRACSCTSLSKVFCCLDNCLSTPDLCHYPPLGTSSNAVNSSFSVGGGGKVVGDLQLLHPQDDRQHGDTIEEEALLEMLGGAVGEKVESVHSWVS